MKMSGLLMMKSFNSSRESVLKLHLTLTQRVEISFNSNLIITHVESSGFSEDLNFLEQLKERSLEEIYNAYLYTENLSSEKEIWNSFNELLRFEVSKVLGREYLYISEDPVVCFCFGIRASEVSKKPPRLGKGCRTCLTVLDGGTPGSVKERRKRHKDISNADWVLFINNKLLEFENFNKWKFEIQSFEFPTLVIIHFTDATQSEEETAQLGIQDFLRSEVDEGLVVFLIRS
jgi:hypothetical protein